MANPRRGEVALVIGDEVYRLRLTLGALAELEAALGAPDLAGLAERFGAGKLSARDLVALLACAMRGAGHAVSDSEIAALPLDEGLEAIVDALARLFEATFGTREGEPGARPLEARAR